MRQDSRYEYCCLGLLGQFHVSLSLFPSLQGSFILLVRFRLTYDLDYGRVLNEIPAHDDAVSCISFLEELAVLVSGSWDCSVKQVDNNFLNFIVF